MLLKSCYFISVSCRILKLLMHGEQERDLWFLRATVKQKQLSVVCVVVYLNIYGALYKHDNLLMFLSAMVQIFSWVKRWNVLLIEVKRSWMEHSNFQRMKIISLLHDWKTFIICFMCFICQINLIDVQCALISTQ